MGGLGVLFAMAAWASGATIDIGQVILQPDTAGQEVLIHVQGTPGVDDVQGITMNVQIADGFPDVPGSTEDGPNITAIDLVGPGTVFGSVGNTGQNDIEQREQIWVVATSTGSGTVLADGLLARLTIDTSGWFAADGPWELKLLDTFASDTNFAPGQVVPTVLPGTILLPEPSALALVLVGGVILLCWRSRRYPAARSQ